MEVDAIEEGKIVRVSEEYARREGLLIIRKKVESNPVLQPVPLGQLRRAERRAKPQVEEFRKPLDYRKNNVIAELKENFQWDITKKRREKNLSRRQLAFMVGESEDVIISLENGFLPRDDFVLLNNVERVLGINIHKNATPATVTLNQLSKSQPHKETQHSAPENLLVPKSSEEEIIDLTDSDKGVLQ
jgi:ribosome-binding protein aMBF1 (putative translation factor)